MAKGKRDLSWKEKVAEWKASGKSIAEWSKEKSIPYTTMRGWINRVENLNKKELPKVKALNGFVELKDKTLSSSGVTLEYQDVKIRLEPEFNAFVLKKCLACLRGMPC
jgi:hypothetical protein